MRMSKKLAAVAAVAVAGMAFSASSATATVSQSGDFNATSDGRIHWTSGIGSYDCKIELVGSIQSGLPGGGGWGQIEASNSAGVSSMSDCSPMSTMTLRGLPWTFELDNDLGGGVWSGVIHDYSYVMEWGCGYTGDNNIEYDNSTGVITLTGSMMVGFPGCSQYSPSGSFTVSPTLALS